MKRQLRILTVAGSMLMAGCSLLPVGGGNASQSTGTCIEPAMHAHGDDAAANRMVVEDRDGRVEVQKVEFRAGVSSTSVERLAKRYGCSGGTGAGLLTARGPVEVYRMQCDNGSVFMARCELRQCRPMR